MSDTKSVEEHDAKTPEDTTSQTSEKSTPESIPFHRFQETNDKKKKLEEELAAYKAKESQAHQQKLEEEGKYEELMQQKEQELVTAKKAALKAEEAMQVISSSNEQMLNEIPEQMRSMAANLKDKLSPTEFHDWLQSNRSVINEMAAKPNLGKSIQSSKTDTYTMAELKKMWRSDDEEEVEKANRAYNEGRFAQ